MVSKTEREIFCSHPSSNPLKLQSSAIITGFNYHDITYSTAMTVAEHKPNFKLTIAIDVYYKDFEEN